MKVVDLEHQDIYPFPIGSLRLVDGSYVKRTFRLWLEVIIINEIRPRFQFGCRLWLDIDWLLHTF